MSHQEKETKKEQTKKEQDRLLKEFYDIQTELEKIALIVPQLQNRKAQIRQQLIDLGKTEKSRLDESSE